MLIVEKCNPKLPKARAPEGDPDLVLGHLKWTITDTSTSQVLEQDERDIMLGELSIKDLHSPRGTLTTVEIPLDPVFTVALSQTEDARKGFALMALRHDVPTFSWDWFLVAGDRAAKLQEAGELALEWDGTRIARTEFLTDVSLRVIGLEGNPDPLNPHWRVLIEKGSVMSWPK